MKRFNPLPWFAVVLAVGTAGAGCGPNWKADIESNTSWYATYGGVSGNTWVTSELSGTGSRTIDLPDEDRVCIMVQQNGSGQVNLTLKDTGGGLFHMLAEDERSGATNVVGGIIEICTEGSIPRSASRQGGTARDSAKPATGVPAN